MSNAMVWSTVGKRQITWNKKDVIPKILVQAVPCLGSEFVFCLKSFTPSVAWVTAQV